MNTIEFLTPWERARAIRICNAYRVLLALVRDTTKVQTDLTRRIIAMILGNHTWPSMKNDEFKILAVKISFPSRQSDRESDRGKRK